MRNKPGGSLPYEDIIVYSLLGITILYILIVRIHLLAVPFERDEGEYAYMGKLILDGHPPYTLAYNMKFPGTYYMYAIIMGIFGKSVVGVHIGLTCITLLSTLLVFWISLRFVSKAGSIISSATFGILGTSSHLLGQAAHATHFVIFFALLAIYVLLRTDKSERNKLLKYLISGFLFSLAFICKQSGLFFVFFGITFIIVREVKVFPNLSILKSLLVFLSGFFIPVVIMLVYFRVFGDFDKFWFWTVKYLSEYSDPVSASEVFDRFKNGINSITGNYSLTGHIALWISSLAGIPLIFITKGTRRNKIIIFSLLIFSFLTIFPGYYFRHHYFVTFLPVAGLMTAVFFDFFNDFFIRKLKSPDLVFFSLIIFMILAGSGIIADRYYLFKGKPEIICKQIYGSNPFAESPEIARFIKQNTSKDDRIAVLGSEPQIYFYSDRYSSTGYIYTYSLVEVHPFALSMQEEMVREVEQNKPEFIIFVNIESSWFVRPDSEKFMLRWADEYIERSYKLVGFMDIYPDKISSLRVREQLNNFSPGSKQNISIFKREQTF